MTLIISAHLGDCVLISADKRSMTCDVTIGNMKLNTNEEQKIKLWSRGAVSGSGETVFIDRVAQYFKNFQEDDTVLNQMDVIYDEIEKRISEGIPQKILFNNVFIFSIFDGKQTLLFSIPIEPFFQQIKKGKVYKIHPYMNEIKDWEVDVSCFNLPPDMGILQEFQRNLKPMEYFNNEQEFLEYYIQNLKHIFATHSLVDPSVSASFDLYIQSCSTGASIALNITNQSLPI